jgi:hypothetical protein
MALKLNPFTGKLELSSAATLQISEDGSLPNGNAIAQIQNGELQNVTEIDAGQYDEQQN